MKQDSVFISKADGGIVLKMSSDLMSSPERADLLADIEQGELVEITVAAIRIVPWEEYAATTDAVIKSNDPLDAEFLEVHS